jgi:hypothetical protein
LSEPLLRIMRSRVVAGFEPIEPRLCPALRHPGMALRQRSATKIPSTGASAQSPSGWVQGQLPNRYLEREPSRPFHQRKREDATIHPYRRVSFVRSLWKGDCARPCEQPVEPANCCAVPTDSREALTPGTKSISYSSSAPARILPQDTIEAADG